MPPTSLYTYSQGNLLESPNTYTYTEYHAESFLEDWYAARSRLLAEAADVEDVAGSFQMSSAPAARTIRAMSAEVQSGKTSPAGLLHLVRRFEITKRVYEAYTPEWRAVDKEAFQDLSLYLGFGQLLAEAYRRHGLLQLLNALLKVNDTLVSVRDRLTDPELAVLRQSVDFEMQSILALIDSGETSTESSE